MGRIFDVKAPLSMSTKGLRSSWGYHVIDSIENS